MAAAQAFAETDKVRFGSKADAVHGTRLCLLCPQKRISAAGRIYGYTP
jgi:hypothetical protein